MRRTTGVDGDRDLADARAHLACLLDALDDVRGRADPDVVLVDELLERQLVERLHDPCGVEAVVGLDEILGRRLVVLGQRRAVAADEADDPVAGLAERRLAVLVEMARVDPDDVGLRAVLGALGAVEVELLLERDVREQRRHGDAPAVLRRELVRAVGGATERDAELPLRERHDLGVGDLEVGAVPREPLVVERLEEQIDCLLVAGPRMLVERNAGLGGIQPCPRPTPNSYRPPVRMSVTAIARGQHGGVVVRERVQHRPEADVLRALRGGGEERGRVRRDRELREEEVLDHGVDVVAEPVGVLDLLQDLGEQLSGVLPGCS